MIATPDKNAVTQAGEVAHAVIEAADLQHLFDALRQRGYELYGPTVNEGAIVYDRIHSAADLPAGWTDEQAPGYYRLVRRSDGALFSYGAGPHSWKRLLHPPTVQLFHAKRDENGDLVTVDDTPAPVKRAFIGVRPCDLAAIGVQDRVFLGGPFVDPRYKARREGNFIVAVNCSHSGANCFSMRHCALSSSRLARFSPKYRIGVALGAAALLSLEVFASMWLQAWRTANPVGERAADSLLHCEVIR